MNPSLLFLGLIHKAGKLQIGEESCGIVARAKKASIILLASDAGNNSLSRAKYYLNNFHVKMLILPFTKSEIGSVIGRGTPGMVAITDSGMAAAFINKLSLEYPGKYDAEKEFIEYKASREQQRRKENQSHKRNLKMGKKK